MQLLQEKSNKYYIFWVCACSLRYPAYNAHAPYCHLRSTPLYNIFSHYLTNCTIFEKKIDEHKMSFVFYLQILIVSHSKNKWVRYDKKMYVGLHVQYRFFWSYFNETWNYFDRFAQNPQIHDLIKIRPEAAGLFHAYRRTDMTKLIVALRNFANKPKDRKISIQSCTNPQC